MQQIVNFILKNKAFLFFLLLFGIAIGLTIQSHNYHKSKFINSANSITGGVYNTSNSVTSYFGLKEENEKLQKENTYLKSLLYNQQNPTNTFVDTTLFQKKYKFTSAKIIKNSYNLQNNYLTINKGVNDSIKQDLGVVSTHGIIGIVDNTNSSYATVISILNTTNKISGQLKNSNHFGTLSWNGQSPNYIQLTDIQKNAVVSKGDTIITSGRSAIFPKGILVGAIEDYQLDATKNYFEINIKLFNDMTNLEHVNIIENKDKSLIDDLLNTNE